MTATPNTIVYRAKTEPTEDVRQPLQHPGFPAPSLGRDAILPPERLRYMTGSNLQWSAVLAGWLERISAEQLVDVAVHYYRTPTAISPRGLCLRETDGALLRETDGEALAWQPGAWSQMVSLLGGGLGPRGGASTFGWLWPAERARCFAELRDRSMRPEGPKGAMILRTHIDPQTGLRALRAVVSGRHSGEHLDDAALAATLNERVAADAPAAVVRGIDETHGWAALAESYEEARAAVYWRNSETGGAQLGFFAGCYIECLDVTLRRTVEGQNTVMTRRVVIESTHGATRRNHTLPRASVTDDERARIARERMLQDFDRAAVSARALAASWREARQTFPAWASAPPRPEDRKASAAVVLDAIEEHSSLRLEPEDREALARVVEDEHRLDSLPWCSAAYIAAAFALVARDADSIESAQRLQHLATEWVLRGWR